MKTKMPLKLNDIRRSLNDGGVVRFVWTTGVITLIENGNSTVVDGRSYQGFLQTVAPKLQKTRTGSQEGKDLVIEWRKEADEQK